MVEELAYCYLRGMSAITSATIIRRSPSLVTSEVDGEIMIMDLEHNRSFAFNDVGSDIWRCIERQCSVAQLVYELAMAYDADQATLSADVLALVNRMTAVGVIEVA